MKKAGVPVRGVRFLRCVWQGLSRRRASADESRTGQDFPPLIRAPGGRTAQESGQGGNRLPSGACGKLRFLRCGGRGSAGGRASADESRTGQDFPPRTGTPGGRAAQKSGRAPAAVRGVWKTLPYEKSGRPGWGVRFSGWRQRSKNRVRRISMARTGHISWQQ